MIDTKVLGVIPARYGSSRFPGKPLVDILGKPMIQRVYEQAQKSAWITELIVATDDNRIFETVHRFGGKVRLTSPDIKNGTERVAVVADQYDHPYVVNIQGDEPLIDPQTIETAIEALIADDVAVVGTLVKKITDVAELTNPNLPKVILDHHGYAIYFSRSVIPYCRDCWQYADWLIHKMHFRHIGLYVYRKEFLKTFVSLPESPLEKLEKLEQLRIIENGYKIKAAIVEAAPQGVDTPEDLQTLIDYLKDHPID